MRRFDELNQLTRVRFRSFLREPEAMFWVFGFPLLLAVVLGFAFRSSEVQPSLIGVLPGDGAQALVERLAAAEHMEVELIEDAGEADRDLRRGKVDVLVTPGDPPLVQLDPQRPEAEVARLRVLVVLGIGSKEDEERLAEIVPVEERGSRYVDFLVPGLLGLNIMGTGMWSIGFAVAEMRQKKLLKRLLVTPMRRSSFLASFFLARTGFLVIEVLLLVVFGTFVLGVPFEAGLGGFAVLCVLGSVAFSGLGMLATARAKTIQGASGMMNLAMMPMWLLSGVFFSYERYPDALQPVLRALPLTALVDALRDMMLDGAGLAAVAPQLFVVTLWGVACYLLALKIFRWQ